jgi:phosphatidylinositol alpha-1,6-mannosyltransferase
MRVLILTPSATGADGISEVSRQAIRALHPRSCPGVDSLDVCTLSEGRMAFALAAARHAIRDVSALTVFVLHVHLAPAALPMITRGARLVVLLHGIESWRSLSPPQAAALRRASRLCAVSSYSVTRFKAANPEFADVTVDVCHPAAPERVRGGLAPERSYGAALIVGRMAANERYKGHDELIEAWPDVRRSVPHARLVVVGAGDDRERLETKARERGLADHVVFTGAVSDETLWALYDACAFLAMPSPNEGFGLVFLEAMQAGKPCLAAPGAAEEIIEHGGTGLIVPSGDRHALTAALVRLFENPETASMGIAAAARVARDFTPEHFAASLRAAAGLGEFVRAC